MAYIEINHEKVTPEIAESFVSICPFGAISQDSGSFAHRQRAKCAVDASKPTKTVFSLLLMTRRKPRSTKTAKGIAVFAEYTGNKIHPVTFELLGNTRRQPCKRRKNRRPSVFAVLPGWQTAGASKELSFYGAQAIYVYDSKPRRFRPSALRSLCLRFHPKGKTLSAYGRRYFPRPLACTPYSGPLPHRPHSRLHRLSNFGRTAILA